MYLLPSSSRVPNARAVNLTTKADERSGNVQSGGMILPSLEGANFRYLEAWCSSTSLVLDELVTCVLPYTPHRSIWTDCCTAGYIIIYREINVASAVRWP